MRGNRIISSGGGVARGEDAPTTARTGDSATRAENVQAVNEPKVYTMLDVDDDPRPVDVCFSSAEVEEAMERAQARRGGTQHI